MPTTTRAGLRLFELETAISKNLEDRASAELVDYEVSRTAGQAARVAMLIRGQDVIEDERQLKKLASVELAVSPPELESALRFLEEADLVQRIQRGGRQILVEKVHRVDHGLNFSRVGEVWQARGGKTDKEQALVATVDQLVDRPRRADQLAELSSLSPTERNAVLEVATNASVIDELPDQKVLFSPFLWDVSPQKLGKLMSVVDESAFAALIQQLRQTPGKDFGESADRVLRQAISAGILPTYKVTSSGGTRQYSFAPYSGMLLTSEAQKAILDKARAIVSSLRYGNEAATITRIRNPAALLSALMDPSRDHKVGPHSEIKGQYGSLIWKQIGRLVPVRETARCYFQLIATPDNLLACRIAMDLLTQGEVVGAKNAPSETPLDAVTASIGHPIQEVKVAKRKRAARADELAGLIEDLQQV